MFEFKHPTLVAPNVLNTRAYSISQLTFKLLYHVPVVSARPLSWRVRRNTGSKQSIFNFSLRSKKSTHLNGW